MNKIRETQKLINTQFTYDLEQQKNDENKLKLVKNYLLKDNTNINIILNNLELSAKLKKDNIKEEIERYSYFLNKETINEKFQNYYSKNDSALDIFFSFFQKILKFLPCTDLENRMLFVNNLIQIEDKSKIDYKEINNYVSYKNNKELYVYLLIDNIRTSIKDQIRNFKNFSRDENNDFIKKYKNEINKCEIYKKVNDYYDINNKSSYVPSKEEIAIYSELVKTKTVKDIEQDICYFYEEIDYIAKI